MAFPSHRVEEKLYHQMGYHFKLPYVIHSKEDQNTLDANISSVKDLKLWYEKLLYVTDYSYLRIKLWEYVRTYFIDYIFIDCIQENLQDKVLGDVNLVCSELRALSYELNVPIIATSQLARGPEHRSGVAGKEPQLGDFCGGDVEQYARLIYFPFRPEYYNINLDEFGNSTDKVVNVIVAKNDNGHLGYDRLMFDREHQRFFSDQSYADFLFGKKEVDLPF